MTTRRVKNEIEFEIINLKFEIIPRIARGHGFRYHLSRCGHFIPYALLVLWRLPGGDGARRGTGDTGGADSRGEDRGFRSRWISPDKRPTCCWTGSRCTRRGSAGRRADLRRRRGISRVLREGPEPIFESLDGKMSTRAGRWWIGTRIHMPVPKGGKCVAAPMEVFPALRRGERAACGDHPELCGFHGCVRLPHGRRCIFNTASVGTPVHIFGTAPLPPPQATPVAQPSPSPTPADTQSKWFPWIKRLRG